MSFAQWGVEIHLLRDTPFPRSCQAPREAETTEQTRVLLCSVHSPQDLRGHTDELFQASPNAIISFSFPFRIVDV